MAFSNWENYTLGDILTFQRGFDITKKEQQEGPYPVVSSSGVQSFHNEFKVKGPGVVIGRKGTLGSVFYINKDFWPHDTTLWIKDFHGNDEKYAYYFLKTLHLEQYDCGASNPSINRNHIHLLSLVYPPLPTQRKIASILSAYDDLIENNTRRIKILEEMAQMVYREWFVKFRFPGYEKAKMVDVPVETLHATSLQKIPEGWEVKPVQNTFEILGGGTPSTKSPEYWENGNINWYSPTDLTASGTMYMEESATKITELGLQKSSARLFPAFSVMMTSRATLGVIAINTTEAATNQGFITCIPNEQFPIYTLYFWLKENVGIFVSLASGATFKEITKGVFKTIDVLVPPRHLTESFEETAGSIGTQVLNLQRRNKNLRQTRDLLLPRLVSGEVDVEGFDININANVET